MSLLVLISDSQDTIFSRVHEFNIDSAEYLWCISNIIYFYKNLLGVNFKKKIHHIYILTFKQSADNLIFKSPGI